MLSDAKKVLTLIKGSMPHGLKSGVAVDQELEHACTDLGQNVFASSYPLGPPGRPPNLGALLLTVECCKLAKGLFPLFGEPELIHFLQVLVDP